MEKSTELKAPEVAIWKWVIASCLLGYLSLGVAVGVCLKTNNAGLAGLAGGLFAIVGVVSLSWLAGVLDAPAATLPGCYYTGALYANSDGKLTASPYPAGIPLRANGVVLEQSGQSWFVSISQCNDSWHASRVAPAFGPWQCLVQCVAPGGYFIR